MKLNRKNVLTTSLAATLAAAMIIGGGTIAYLQDDTEKVVNEFDTNKVLVKLSETGTNEDGINDSYEIIPGTSAAKDPKVTVDNTLDSYVYVRVTDTTENLVKYQIADGWQLLDGFTDVYYREVSADSENEFYVLADNTVYYDAALQNSDMLTANGELKDGIKLTFKAFAIQKTPFDDPMLAYGYAAGTAVTDESSIQNAVNAANTAEEPAVLLLNKDVSLESPLTINAEHGLTLVGDGTTTVTGKPISLNCGENVIISGIDFKNGTIRDNDIKESSIYVKNTDEIKNLVIENCSFKESGWDCIQLTNPNIESIAIRGNSFENTDSSNPGRRYIHLELRDAANNQYTASNTKLEITGNTFTDSNLNHTGIYLYSKGKIMIHLTFDYKTDEKCTTPGQYLKYHRTFQGLSTRELAEKVGIVPATLVLYENNRHPIKYSTAVALANVLGIDRNRLLDKYTAFVDYPYSSLLKKVRQELSLTQMQMAEVIGIGQTSYSGWEREIRVPRRKEYEKILAALKKLKVNVDTYLCHPAST